MKRRPFALALSFVMLCSCLSLFVFPIFANDVFKNDNSLISNPSMRDVTQYPYVNILKSAIQRKDSGYDYGEGFLFDANNDGIEELFYLYCGKNNQGYTSIYGAVYTIKNGKAFPIHPIRLPCFMNGIPTTSSIILSARIRSGILLPDMSRR